MLSKEDCLKAVLSWDTAKESYSRTEQLINPVFVFDFEEKDCNWIEKFNDNKAYIYARIGVYREQLNLIITPLDKNGKPKDLEAFLNIPLTPLQKNLVLLEREETVVIKKTTLSRDLDITHCCEETELPVYNNPVLNEKTSLEEIEMWKNNCLDWFYRECTEFNGKRIFRTFTIPFTDLIKDNSKFDKIIAVFGLKYSVIYQRYIPTLIFIAVDTATMQAQIRNAAPAGTINTDMLSNAYDWSRPCPPFCREKLEEKN